MWIKKYNLPKFDTVVVMRYGSVVYGTNVSESDNDFVGIYIPKAKDILLSEVKDNLKFNTKTNENVKNTKDDVDIQIFSLKNYLKLLLEGQTVAVDMLFTPKEFYVDYKQNEVWELIQIGKEYFLHSGITAFAGYCRKQAYKYTTKVERIDSIQKTLEFFKSLDPNKKVIDYELQIKQFVEGINEELGSDEDKLIQVIQLQQKNTGKYQDYLEVCQRKYDFLGKVKMVTEQLQKVYSSYGERTKKAQENQYDWKSLMHALRVVNEAKELLDTGNVTLPRPEASLLLKIRKGELSYQEVINLIETGLVEMEDSLAKSKLRKTPSQEAAEMIVMMAHRKKILDVLDRKD